VILSGRFRVILALALPLVLAAFSFTSPASAQAWPTRAITLVVPFGPGVSSDTMARGLAEFLGRELGQSVIVENRGGAGGNIGAAAVARATPDGYTFLFATTGQAATNKLMYKKLTFDSDRDLQPVVLLGKLPVIIAAKKGGKFTSMQAVVEYAKTNPGKLNIGFPGNGTLGHITGLLFARNAGISINAVQYTGSAQIISDILGGHIDVAMDSAGAYMSNVAAGDVAALALASAKRFAPLPEVPTVSESGLPGFEASVWYALLAPTGVSADIVAKLNSATNAFLASEKGRAFYGRVGVEVVGGTPAELKAFIAAEQAKWGPVIQDAKIEF
jgi:tripartite-type tricarboxylate transporter receptor subunit TctC